MLCKNWPENIALEVFKVTEYGSGVGLYKKDVFKKNADIFIKTHESQVILWSDMIILLYGVDKREEIVSLITIARYLDSISG